MAEETKSGRTLDYTMSSSFMESYGKALKPTWQRSDESLGAGIADDITSGLNRAFTAYEAGRAITAAQEGKWEDATTRDAWNTKEQYEAFIALEKEGKDAYLEAVRTGDKEEQAKLLAEQAERKAGLKGWGESATLAIDNDQKVGWASSDRVYNAIDKHMVGEVVQNRNVTYRMEDGQMQIGIDYSEIYKDPNLKAQLGIPPLKALRAMGHTEASYLKTRGYELKDGKLTRYVTKGQFDKTVTGAIAPTTMSRDLVNSLDGFRKTGATDEGYFDGPQTSLDFQQNINKDNLKTLMHEPLLGGQSWAEQVEIAADTVWSPAESSLYMAITGKNPDTSGATDANGDPIGDGKISDAEAQAAGYDDAAAFGTAVQQFMFDELEKPANADIIKKELGDWWAGKAEKHFNDGKNSVVTKIADNKTRESTRAGGNPGPAGNNRAGS